MKISEVLEAYNKFLETYREKNNIKCRGHFISLTAIKKSMGPYKEFYIHIYYINSDKSKYPFVTSSTMEKCPKEREEYLIDKLSLNTLHTFFSYLHEDHIFELVVNDKYGRTE